MVIKSLSFMGSSLVNTKRYVKRLLDRLSKAENCDMEIKDYRRLNLKKWFSTRAIPPEEKSYLSQLMTGRGSFGERAARRLEQTYGMDVGY